jgi:tetratricopeptide (TPR) repeat protein
MNAVHPLYRYLWQAGLLLSLTIPFGLPTCTAEIPGYPASVQEYDAREVAMLPRYCIYTQQFRERVPGGNNPAEIERWYSVMGGTFHAMHHYCWGLMKTNRAIVLARNQEDRKFYLADAIGEYDYVIVRAPADFVLLPEFFTKKGENLLRLGKIPEGIANFHLAIDKKPDYWPPYAALSDHFKQTKDLTTARQWLEKGLSASPDAKALQQRLADLGGAKGLQSAPPPQSKSQSPAKNAVLVPLPHTENPEPPARR